MWPTPLTVARGDNDPSWLEALFEFNIELYNSYWGFLVLAFLDCYLRFEYRMSRVQEVYRGKGYAFSVL